MVTSINILIMAGLLTWLTLGFLILFTLSFLDLIVPDDLPTYGTDIEHERILHGLLCCLFWPYSVWAARSWS